MPYTVETVTSKGSEIFATLADHLMEHLTITGCYAVKNTVSLNDAMASGNILNESGWNNTAWLHTTRIEMSGVTTDTQHNTSSLMVYAQFMGDSTSHGSWTTGDKQVKTFYLHGHLNNSPNTEYVLGVASDANSTRIPEVNDIINIIEVRFTLTFTPLDADSTITVPSNNDYVLRSEYNTAINENNTAINENNTAINNVENDLQTLTGRVVTTHAEGTPTVGENQEVWGIKKFLDPVDFFGVAKAYTYNFSGLDFLSFAPTDSTGSPNFLYGPCINLCGSRASGTGFISGGCAFVGNTTFDGPVASVSVRASEESGSKVSEIVMRATTGSSSSDPETRLTLTPTTFTVDAPIVSKGITPATDNMYDLGFVDSVAVTNNKRFRNLYLSESLVTTNIIAEDNITTKEIDIKKNYVKNLLLKDNNNLFEYLEISKEATFNKDGNGNPQIVPYYGIDTLMNMPRRAWCDLTIIGYDYVLDSNESTIYSPNTSYISTLVLKKGNRVQPTSEHSSLLPSKIKIKCYYISSSTGSTPQYSLTLFISRLEAEFSYSAFNDNKYNKYNFYPNVHLGHFYAANLNISNPEETFGSYDSNGITFGSLPFNGNSIDDAFNINNPYIDPTITSGTFILSKDYSTPVQKKAGSFTSNLTYFMCSVEVMSYTKQKPDVNLVSSNKFSLTGIFDLGSQELFRGINTIFCNAIDIAQSARLPHVSLESGSISSNGAIYKVPLGGILSVRLLTNTTVFPNPSSDVEIPAGTEFDVDLYAGEQYSIFSYTENGVSVKMYLYPLMIKTDTNTYQNNTCIITKGGYISFTNIVFSYSTPSGLEYEVMIQRVR